MGNTIEEIESTNVMECTTTIKDVHASESDHNKSFSLIKALEAVINDVPENMKDEISLELLLREINAENHNKKKVQRVKGLINQAEDVGLRNQAENVTLNGSEKNSNLKYYSVPHCSNDVPKVRLHDVVLNIKSKTGDEGVPPRKDELGQNLSTKSKQSQNSSTKLKQSQNLSKKSDIISMIKNFEADIYELQDQSVCKCESIFASLSDQN